MMLEALQPYAVFHWFEEISSIPRGSGSTPAIAEWCVRFAKERELRFFRDEADNVVIFKEASPGYEGAPTIILQGHLDMVCEKAAGCTKDMSTEGLDLRCDGEWVWADGTTLGGDDGIAAAMALAILDDDSLPHPPLEVLLTSNEEIGLLGAQAFDASVLQGRRMLNLDHSEEGSFIVGCAGGNRTCCTLPVHREPYAASAWCVAVSGLLGGHSGVFINQGRGNASILLGRMLQELSLHMDLRLVLVRGGLKDNAIPVAAEAQILVPPGADVQGLCAAFASVLQKEFRRSDPGIAWNVSPCQPELTPMDQASTARCLCLLTCAPNGLQELSQDMPGLPQTSLNLGVLTTSPEALDAVFSLRSSLASQKEMLLRRLSALTRSLGGSIEVRGDYPAWEYQAESPLRDLLAAVYQEQSGSAPSIEVTHGGLECGVLSKKIPGLDCVSFGPNIPDIHTPRERMEVASVQRVWKLLLEVLRLSR